MIRSGSGVDRVTVSWTARRLRLVGEPDPGTSRGALHRLITCQVHDHDDQTSSEPVHPPRCVKSPDPAAIQAHGPRSEEHTSELQSRGHLVCRLLLEKKKTIQNMLANQITRHALCPCVTCALCDSSLYFFSASPPTELYTLSLHDALPISRAEPCIG